MHQIKKIIYIMALVCLALNLVSQFAPNSRDKILVEASKKTDILFLKGKFILKDKKGSIVISDDKKCHCPHFYR